MNVFMKRLLVTVILLCASSEFSFAQYGKWGFIQRGDTYYILQYRLKLREQPSLDSPSVTVLSLGDKVEILEPGVFTGVIDDYFEEWYKIKRGDVIGFVYGGDLAPEILITDIDNDGINDYFLYRSRYYYYSGQNLHRDIFIFINNRRLDTSMLNTYSSDYELSEPYFGWCEFEKRWNFVYMKISLWGNKSQDGNDYAFKNIYKIDSNGEIEFVDWELGTIRGKSYRKRRKTESDLQEPVDDDWEWFTLEGYERFRYKGDNPIEGIVISDDGQLWFKTWYSGK